LTHNRCYWIKKAQKGTDYEATVKERIYIEVIFLRYKRASVEGKTIIQNEFDATCGFHCKHAMRLLRAFKRFIKTKAKKRGRAPIYHHDTILKPLKQIWLVPTSPPQNL
jgi:hypothetical protein